ncbi:MAG: hypothetical protein RID42_16055 [Alphaproteobacteria bacterium]
MSTRLALVRDGVGVAGWCLGAVLISLAAVHLVAGTSPRNALAAVTDGLGPLFAAGAIGLVGTALVAWYRVRTGPDARLWFEVGSAAANGLVTLALTFTLVGISAGITTLHGRTLSPETVQPIIAELGEAFGRAFLTTIVGLPVAAALRALLGVSMTMRIGTGSTP